MDALLHSIVNGWPCIASDMSVRLYLFIYVILFI